MLTTVAPAPAVVEEILAAAAMPAAEVLQSLGTSPVAGLPDADVRQRQLQDGPNSVATHQVRALPVLWHQLRSPLLALLVIAAAASFFVGERSAALIIGVIVVLSVGLGFVNEYRAEKAGQALHSQITHQTAVIRGGRRGLVDVTSLVRGDVVELHLGEVVPADVRLLSTTAMECDESVLTGESFSVSKSADPVAAGTALAELTSCALMGTVVRAGNGRGVVVSTGARTEFGKIAAGLNTHQLDTAFQLGLRRFSMLLAYVGIALTSVIFVINVVLQRPILDALLFSLAIAVGITPQLLPAVVSTSLAAGAARMRQRKVLVKRLVCIEDLGDIDTLFTDKTGTLTQGQIQFMRAVPVEGCESAALVRWGLLATENAGLSTGRTAGPESAIGGNPLDQALWDSPAAGSPASGSSAAGSPRAETSGYTRLSLLPFDHDRRMVSALVQNADGRTTLVTKGAPENVIARCSGVPDSVRQSLAREFAAGNRVIAVATRPWTRPPGHEPGPQDEQDLTLQGLLVFLDPPKPDAAQALSRLAGLGVAVKVVTGDNAAVAVKVCTDLGLPGSVVLTGSDLDVLDDDHLNTAIGRTTVFARISPEQKARIVRVQRRGGGGVAFLGDGVNDALALHAADVGISVDSATDVAKDAADVILLEKSLDVLADGVVEGRRIFANTIKYVLMGTSSNFGNMFSAAGASLFLGFLPMLPSQILLNNLLYDTSQLAIPTDNVDEEQLRRPSHWDIAFIRRFMIFFGPLSSVFDFLTFGVMLWVFHSGAAQFRSGWFVESLATQTLVIFAIRTRRIPFFRSTPSLPLVLAALSVVVAGALLPATPLAHALGFQPLPIAFFAALVGMVLAYLVLIEAGKHFFYRAARLAPPPSHTSLPNSPLSVVHPAATRHLRRRIARFTNASSGAH